MARRQSVRSWSLQPSRSAAGAALYLLLCGSIAFTGATLRVTGFAIAARDLPRGPPPALEIPVARIQSLPDRDDMCRTLLFHNDTGRYQEAVRGKCMIPKDLQVWTFTGRAAAFADAFRSAWKGDSVALSSR
jgi:hypothetical protein